MPNVILEKGQETTSVKNLNRKTDELRKQQKETYIYIYIINCRWHSEFIYRVILINIINDIYKNSVVFTTKKNYNEFIGDEIIIQIRVFVTKKSTNTSYKIFTSTIK